MAVSITKTSKLPFLSVAHPDTCSLAEAFETDTRTLLKEYKGPRPEKVNDAIMAELQAPSPTIFLRFDEASAQGDDGDASDVREKVGKHGIAAYTLGDFRKIFDSVHIESVPVALESGGAFVAQAAILAALQRERNVSTMVDASFGADPLSALARIGMIPRSVEQSLLLMADMAKWTHLHRPRCRAVAVSTRVYRTAGATPAQEVAIAIATATAYLDAIMSANLSAAIAASQISFTFSAGPDPAVAQAKIVAAGKLWSDHLTTLGVTGDAAKMSFHLTPVAYPDVGMTSSQTAESVDDLIQSLAARLTARAMILATPIQAQGGMVPALISGFISRQLASSDLTIKPVGGCKGTCSCATERATLLPEIVRNLRDWRVAHPQALPALSLLREVIRTKLGSGEVTEYAVRAAVAGATLGQISAALLTGQLPTQITPLASLGGPGNVGIERP